MVCSRHLSMMLNLFLMWIAFVPSPTSLLCHHPGQSVVTAFCGGVCSLSGLSFCIIRWYASLRERLIKNDLGDPELRCCLGISLRSPILYLAGTVSSFFPAFAMCL